MSTLIPHLWETGEKFSVPYKDRFKEGEYKNRTQFMFGGEPQRLLDQMTMQPASDRRFGSKDHRSDQGDEKQRKDHDHNLSILEPQDRRCGAGSKSPKRR